MAEGGGSLNLVCLVDCMGAGGRCAAADLLTELTGRPVSERECHAPIPWSIDNKYYSAEVEWVVCGSDSGEVGAGRWEGMVLLCSLQQSDSLQTACTTWEHIADHVTPAVCLLVGVDGEWGKGCHQKALEWCVGHGFELVEWRRGEEGSQGGEEKEEEEEEDDFPEEVGVARISQALQAHLWPSLEMKKRGGLGKPVPEASSSAVPGEEVETQQSGGSQGSGQDSSSGEGQTSATRGEAKMEDKSARERIDELLGRDAEGLLAEGLDDKQERGGDSFEQLFARFAEMKGHAQSLSHEERKAFAEKVVMAFWQAIGGDEGEIDGSDSDTDS